MTTISVATAKIRESFLMIITLLVCLLYIVTVSPAAPRLKRLGEPLGSDLYKKSTQRNIYSLNALVAQKGSILFRRTPLPLYNYVPLNKEAEEKKCLK